MQTQFNELTDAQWLFIAEYLPLQRKRKHDLRLIMDAIFYINRTGVQWRNLNFKNPFFPKWQIVYYYFRTWTKLGVFIKINEKLVELERLRQEKETLPDT